MRPLLLTLLLLAPAAHAARLLAIPAAASGADPTLAADLDRALADAALETGQVDVIAPADTAPVIASVPCDGALACTLARGRSAHADLVLLTSAQNTERGVAITVRLVDVVAQTERGHADAAEPRETIARAARSAVFQLLAPDRFIGRISVETDQIGSVIIVDGVMKGSTPMLAAIEVPPGRHEVEIRYGSELVLRRFVDVPFDDTARVRVGAAVNADPATAAAKPASPSTSPLFLGGVGLLGVGAVCAVVGGATYVIALGQVDRIKSGKATAEDRTSNEVLGPTSLVFLGAAVVSLGAGGVLLVLGSE